MGFDVTTLLRRRRFADPFRALFRDGGKGALLSSAAPAANYQTNAGVTLAGFGDPVGLALDTKNGVPAVRRNLLIYSEDFSNAAWTKARSAISANATAAPDGSLTADKLVEDSTPANTHQTTQVKTTTAAVHTISVFFKQDERSWVRLIAQDGGAYFNLATGALGTVSAGTVSASASAPTNEGGGWYRCSLTFTAIAGSTTIAIRLADSDGGQTYDGDGVSGVFVWGAQLELGSTATAYQRVDATWADTIPGAHFSTSVTADRLTRGREPLGGVRNLLDYSEQFDNAAWGKQAAAAVTPNTAAAPDGTQTATTLSGADGTTFTGNVLRYLFAPPSTPFHGSIFVKSLGAATTATLYYRDGSTGNVSSETAALTADYVRLGRSFNYSTSSFLYLGNTDGDVAIWGAQFELGSVATAYQNRTTINDVTEAGVPDVPFYRFDGVSDRLEGNATARDILKDAPGAEAHAAIRWTGADNAWVLFVSRNGGNDPRFALETNTDGSLSAHVRRADADATTTVSTAAGAITANVRTIVGLSVDYVGGGASAITIWVNGVASATGELTGTGNTSDTTADAVIFGANAAGTQFFPGQIFREIPMLARVLLTPERSAMLARLAALTGVTL